MATEIKLPKLSDTMEEGTLLRWLKKEGDEVQSGEVIAEVETDKADMELESDQAGTISEIRVKEGEQAAVGAVLAVLSADGERKKKAPAQGEPSESEAADSTTADAEAGAPEADDEAAAPDASESESESESEGEPAPAPSKAKPAQPKGKPAKVAPESAKATASPQQPSSAKPRIVLPPSSSAKGSAATEEKPPAAAPPMSKLRAAVAKQMVASKRDIPHFYLTCEIDMSEAARLRKSLSESREFPERLTFTHIILRALALTLMRHPRLNASWAEEEITFHEAVHLGIAVAVEDGLIAPVLRDCQKRSLRNLARAVAGVVEKVQSGRSEKLTGATFTLSNLGMLDIEQFTAVITPPQSAILAVGSIKDRAVVRDGQLAVAKTMHATVSADHRVSTGYEVGRFLEDLKNMLENPVMLVLGEEQEQEGQ